MRFVVGFLFCGKFEGIFGRYKAKGPKHFGKISEHFSEDMSELKNKLSCQSRSADEPPNPKDPRIEKTPRIEKAPDPPPGL